MYRYIFGVGAILILVLFGFWYWRSEAMTGTTPTAMRAELADFLPHDAQNDSLSDKDIRLRYYATLHLLDPQMALPGTDLSILTNTIEAMSSSTRVASEVYTEWIDREILYPFELIRSFASTESARRQMRDEPTAEVIANYHEKLMSLFSDYETSLEKIETFLTENEALGPIKFWQGTTRSAYVKEVMARVRPSVAKARQVEEDRYACVARSYGHRCPSLNESRKLEELLAPEDDDTVLDRSTVTRAGFFADHFFLVRGKRPEPLVRADEFPIVLLTDSRCAPNGGAQFVSLYDIETRVSGVPGLRLFGLDDIYLYDVWKEQESGFLPMGPKVPETFRYTLQPDNYYTCADYGHDAHMALTVAYIKEGVVGSLPVVVADPDDESRAIEDAARRLQAAKVPSDNLVATFVARIDSALLRHGDVWLENKFGYEAAERLITYRDAWRAKSGWFELALGTIDDFMVRTLYARSDGTPTIDAPWFFISHANLVSFYQLANSTVSKDTPSLLKERNETDDPFPGTFPGILSYEQELKDLIPSHSLLHDRLIGADAYIRDHLLKGD